MADKDFRVKLGLHVGANAYIEGNITSVDSIQMNVASPTAVGGAGQLAWNINENTIDVGMNANTTLQLGQEQYYYVKNQTGSLIPDGTVVMANGTVGASGRIKVAPAIADGTFPSKYIIGMTTEDIPDGGDGFVTVFGKIRDIDTSMFNEGDILYADPAVPGGLANTVPVAPNNIVTVAIVINKHANNGTLFVRPTYGSNIHENEDVHTQGLSDGQALVYVAANARFENKTVASVQANSFSTIVISGQSNVVADSSADTLTLAAGSGIQLTTDASTDTITITNTGGSGGGLIAGDYVVRATKTGGQTITAGSDTVVTMSDDFDPQGWWTSDKFQPTIAGYYSINAQVWWDAGVVTNNQTNIQLRKNGTTQIAVTQNQIVTGSGYAQNLGTIVYFNGTTDYVEVTAYTGNTTSQTIVSAPNGTWFTAALYAYGDAANSWVNANDATTLLTARSNDAATLLSAYSNDYSTLLSAYANDKVTTVSVDNSTNNNFFILATQDVTGDLGSTVVANAKISYNPSTGTVSSNAYAVGGSELIGSARNLTNYAVTLNARGSISGSQTIDLALGNFVTATATGSITWTFSNASASHASGFVLELTNGGSAAQIWPGSVRWPGGTAPTLTASGVDVLVFVTDDAGTNWRGAASMLDSKAPA